MEERAVFWGLSQLKGWGQLRLNRAMSGENGLPPEVLLEKNAGALPFPMTELADRWQGVLDRTSALGGHIISWNDASYPQGLTQMIDAPNLLHVKGQISAWDRPLIAVVGTRRCSDAAARWAYRAGAHIAAAGGTLVSGLALGIDIAAMRGALDAGGVVVACLGHGLERVHPKGHAQSAEAMLENGAWITEYPVYTHVDRWHFAHRNRIVAGLASATLLVQSPANGGGMITARLAVEYNRDLLVLDPLEDRPDWQGNRFWINDGATCISRVEDIIKEASVRQPLVPRRMPPEGLVPVWTALQGSGGCTVQDVAEAVELPNTQARRQLLALELGGWVRRSPGGLFFPSGS
jgi:DNA processing protein